MANNFAAMEANIATFLSDNGPLPWTSKFAAAIPAAVSSTPTLLGLPSELRIYIYELAVYHKATEGVISPLSIQQTLCAIESGFLGRFRPQGCYGPLYV